MKSKLFGVLGMVVSVLMLVSVLFPLATPAAAEYPAYVKPIIFVHGGAGSAAQFESQAMRFASNGYPADYIFGFDYDSSLTAENIATVLARLDAFVDACRAQTGADKVYMLGHSMGTSVMVGQPPGIPVGYLGVPERAAKVAKYVNIDGRTAPALPGGVPTLALWATKGWSYNPLNTIVGATNVFIPNVTHVQCATSAASFVEMYKFFTGEDPVTTDILPEPCDQVKLAGRAVFFPQNVGVGNATLEIWEVNGATGARIGAVPQATYTLTGSGPGPTAGAWGPFNANSLKRYEFVILRAGARPHHFYFEPFIRSDYLVRLLTSPTGGIGDLMERNMNSAALVITRNKEFWGDQGADNDVLTINGTNIINAATCPLIKGVYRTGVIGIFAYDRYLDGLTSLSAPIPAFYATSFMTGVDIYIPAADPPNGTISLVLTPRGGGGKTQVINMLNWASLDHSMSAPFNDYILGQKLTSIGPANIWVGLKNSDEVGAKFNLKAEVYNGAQLVGSGEVLGVSAGSSGFNNARLSTINITPVPGAQFFFGDTLSIKLLVRKSGSRYSPTARLWYDGKDTRANSSFAATIGCNAATYYLRSDYTLSTAVGTGNPGLSIDVGSLPTGGPYKSFGIWSTTLP